MSRGNRRKKLGEKVKHGKGSDVENDYCGTLWRKVGGDRSDKGAMEERRESHNLISSLFSGSFLLRT